MTNIFSLVTKFNSFVTKLFSLLPIIISVKTKLFSVLTNTISFVTKYISFATNETVNGIVFTSLAACQQLLYKSLGLSVYR